MEEGREGMTGRREEEREERHQKNYSFSISIYVDSILLHILCLVISDCVSLTLK